MKNRKKIDYDKVVEIGLSLLKDEIDMIYGIEDKSKAESALRMSGIIDFLNELNKATLICECDQACECEE